MHDLILTPQYCIHRQTGYWIRCLLQEVYFRQKYNTEIPHIAVQCQHNLAFACAYSLAAYKHSLFHVIYNMPEA
jgi:hypothetical protein